MFQLKAILFSINPSSSFYKVVHSSVLWVGDSWNLQYFPCLTGTMFLEFGGKYGAFQYQIFSQVQRKVRRKQEHPGMVSTAISFNQGNFNGKHSLQQRRILLLGNPIPKINQVEVDPMDPFDPKGIPFTVEIQRILAIEGLIP
nr:hypothetical protein Iba_chr09cCG9810 [Ipomoea batatas]